MEKMLFRANSAVVWSVLGLLVAIVLAYFLAIRLSPVLPISQRRFSQLF
jgi:hypothetical protein